MRHPPARPDGRGHLSAPEGGPHWLLIGNSRWHWARGESRQLRTWHASPPPPGALPELVGWAAVGAVPEAMGLPADRRLHLAAVPLAGAPPWLGIDRALAGWGAWRRNDGPVLVADAGTVLSLTRVDGAGRFRGGRLMAGQALQLRAMAMATTALPALPLHRSESGANGQGEPWPAATPAAMVEGVRRGLAAAIASAVREAAAEAPDCRLVLTGGDGPDLLDLLAGDPTLEARPWEHRPDLCLEALARLRPAPDR